MGRTKDEQFILSAYETALGMGDINETLDRYEVGKRAGISPKAVDAICQQLNRANFIKKRGEIDICLTSNGEALALRLLQEK